MNEAQFWVSSMVSASTRKGLVEIRCGSLHLQLSPEDAVKIGTEIVQASAHAIAEQAVFQAIHASMGGAQEATTLAGIIVNEMRTITGPEVPEEV